MDINSISGDFEPLLTACVTKTRNVTSRVIDLASIASPRRVKTKSLRQDDYTGSDLLLGQASVPGLGKLVLAHCLINLKAIV